MSSIHVDNYMPPYLVLYIQYAHISMNTYICCHVGTHKTFVHRSERAAVSELPRVRSRCVFSHSPYIHTLADVPPIAPRMSHAYFLRATFDKSAKCIFATRTRCAEYWFGRAILRYFAPRSLSSLRSERKRHRKAPIYSREYYVIYPHVHHARNRWDSVKCALTLSLSRACTCSTV